MRQKFWCVRNPLPAVVTLRPSCRSAVGCRSWCMESRVPYRRSCTLLRRPQEFAAFSKRAACTGKVNQPASERFDCLLARGEVRKSIKILFSLSTCERCNHCSRGFPSPGASKLAGSCGCQAEPHSVQISRRRFRGATLSPSML